METRAILFNTDMVRAILDGRKTVTRRAVKIKSPHEVGSVKIGKSVQPGAAPELICCNANGRPVTVYTAPCRPGDILWVRETWTTLTGEYIYQANQKSGMKNPGKWRPSIHMPKEAARIFLRVKNVEVQRLREMVLADVLLEGIEEADDYYETWDRWHSTWDSTIKPADRDKYGWAANPWVWVIEFERCGKPEEF